MTNYYEVLGVSRDASDETIRNRFRALARDAHPDRVTDPAKKAGAWTARSQSCAATPACTSTDRTAPAS